MSLDNNYNDYMPPLTSHGYMYTYLRRGLFLGVPGESVTDTLFLDSKEDLYTIKELLIVSIYIVRLTLKTIILLCAKHH